MKVIILGAGQVGASVAENLVSEANDITLVDTAEDHLAALRERIEVRTVVGNGASPKVLREAGAEDADLLIAVTQSDQTNLCACRIAKAIFKLRIKGWPVKKVLVAKAAEITSEAYFAITLDREARRHVVIASASGGVDIEEVAAKTPDRIVRRHLDPGPKLAAEAALDVARRIYTDAAHAARSFRMDDGQRLVLGALAEAPRRDEPGQAEDVIGVAVGDCGERRRVDPAAERELHAFAGVDEQVKRLVPQPVAVHPAREPGQVGGRGHEHVDRIPR